MSDTLSRLTNRPVRTAKFTRPLDPNDGGRVGTTRKELTRAQAALNVEETSGTDDQKVVALTKALKAAEKAHKAAVDAVATFTVHVKAVPPYAVEALITAHPPTSEQKVKARAANNGDPNAEPAWNHQTFPAALISAAVDRIEISDAGSDPVTSITAEAMLSVMREWPDHDQLALFTLVQNVSQAGSNVEADLGKG